MSDRKIHPLRVWAVQHGLTVGAIALSHGRSASSMSHWLSGARVPPVEVITAIAEQTLGEVGSDCWVVSPPDWRSRIAMVSAHRARELGQEADPEVPSTMAGLIDLCGTLALRPSQILAAAGL